MGLKEDFLASRSAGQPATQVPSEQISKDSDLPPIPSIKTDEVMMDNTKPDNPPQKPVAKTNPLLEALLKKKLSQAKPLIQTSTPGVAATGKARSQSPSPSPSVKKPSIPRTTPYVLPNGNTVVKEDPYDPSELANEAISANAILARHKIQIIKMTGDASQTFPYLMNCSCGNQARTYSQADAESAAQFHIAKRMGQITAQR